MLAFLVAAMMLPATAGAQAPAIGGYVGTGPSLASGTTPPVNGSQPSLAPPGVVGSQPSRAPRAAPPGPGAPAPAVKSALPRGTLPFTGLQISFMLAAGLGLLGLGLALRRTSGPAPPAI